MISAVNSINFRGGGSESLGSTGYTKGGSETSGSIGNNNRIANPISIYSKSLNKSPNDLVSFQGRDNSEKKFPTGKVIFGVAGLAAATILSLGYAHKSGAFNKIEKEWLQKTLGKLKPAGKKCYQWCSTVKTKGSELWTKFTNIFKSKS